MTCNGNFVAGKQITLSAGNLFEGTGLIKAPTIEISTKCFEFTGTIDCSGTCTIKSEEPFDAKMFKRTGGGEFIIIIEPFKPQNENFEAPQWTPNRRYVLS